MKKEALSLKEIQKVSLNILKQIADLCEEQNIRYYLCMGTLLGAIRHKGFIPWDDDIDIMVPRPDYDRLMEYLYNNKLPNLTLFNRQTHKNYPYMISRISDDRYILEMENEESVGMGIFIDVYPMDGMGATLKEALKYGIYNDRMSSFCYQATRKHFAIENTKSTFRKIVKLPVYLVSKAIGKDFFMDRIEKHTGRYEYETSEWVGDLVWLNWGASEIFKREWFDEYIVVPFEEYEFRVPKEYDAVLRHEFGDYMTLPPVEERIAHHFYKAYKK